ncbi:LysR substrate-binding domain-containing protein [Pseudomonas entomophila]|uniref:LysR substrate-binding domain-containing protein n=1 Tax=Pseudomonas entomophila TaxID=312306 RepID=UPI003EBECF58
MSERIPALQALRAFEVAARHGSFTRAAEQLCISQGAISQHVKTVEAMFGCALFERRGPRLRLTEHGRSLATQLGAGFALIEDACAVLKHERHGIRLKAPSTVSVRWLLRALDTFRQQADGFAVHLSSVWMDVDQVDFQSEPYDCAVLLGGPTGHGGADSLLLFDEWLVPVCSPRYLIDAHLGLAALNQCQLLHPSLDRRDWRRWLAAVGGTGVEITRGQVFDTLDQGISAAVQGLGVSVVDLALASDELACGRLVMPFRQAVATGDGYRLHWPGGSPKRAALHRLGDFLQRCPPAMMTDGIEWIGLQDPGR